MTQLQALFWQNLILWITLGVLVGAAAGWALAWFIDEATPYVEVMASIFRLDNDVAHLLAMMTMLEGRRR